MWLANSIKNESTAKSEENYFFNYFLLISMWFYSNFDQEHSLDGEFNSASNEYPHGILLVDPAPRKTRNTWKTWCWCHHHIFWYIYYFSWCGVHQKYAKWVLVGCGIQFPIQRVLSIKIWVKPHGDKLKIRVEKIVFSLDYLFTILTIYSTFLILY